MADTTVDTKQTEISLKFYFQRWYTYSRFPFDGKWRVGWCRYPMSVIPLPSGLPGLPSGTSQKVTKFFSKGCDWLLLH